MFIRNKTVIGLLVMTFILTAFSAVSAAKDDPIQVFFNNPYANKRDYTLLDMLQDDINNAEDSIYVATYNFTSDDVADALCDAIDRGVEVNLVIDQDSANDRCVKDLQAYGAGLRVHRSDGLMHSKYLIIDDRITISGSANLTPGSFYYDNNYLIRIDDKDVADIFTDEFNEMFEDGDFGEDSPRSSGPKSVELSDGTIVMIGFSPDDGIEDKILQLLGVADESAYVLAYSFALDSIGDELIDMYLDEDVDVIVIFEGEKAYTDGGGEAENLRDAGVPVFLDGSDDALMHEKAIILDENVVIAGSYNFTRSAEERNDEQILFIQNQDVVDAFMNEFQKIYDSAIAEN